MGYRVGTLLNINGLDAKVIGYIQYVNPQDGGKDWTEYRLQTNKGECWLSCDDIYQEYSISWPANQVRGQIGPEWHKVDEGMQVVKSYGGNVDVDPGERASFVEYEDESEDHTLSVEMWSDGTEYSTGEYIEKSDIRETGFEEPKSSSNNAIAKLAIWLIVITSIICFFGPVLTASTGGREMSKYLKDSSYFVYETSITGNEKQEATVYRYDYSPAMTDDVALRIIDGIEGKTESVTQKDDVTDAEIAIVTKKEYCLVYHPEGEEGTVFVQISDRKYNYTSDNEPYRCSKSVSRWYRSHYFSSSYTKDASTFKKSSSAYAMYDGDTIHNIGNGYFDSYSNSVRQASINNRSSDGGGLSSGK